MKILINGSKGHMGAYVKQAVERGYEGAEPAGFVDVTDNSLQEFTGPADCIIDFSHRAATKALMDYAVARNMPIVVATTGQTEEDMALILEMGANTIRLAHYQHAQALIRQAAKVIPVFRSGNMALGVTLMCDLVKTAVKAFPDADVEILEIHHTRKVDAPSGTAVMLGNAALEARPDAHLTVGRPAGNAARRPEHRSEAEVPGKRRRLPAENAGAHRHPNQTKIFTTMLQPLIVLLQAGYYAEPAASRYSAASTGMFFLIIAIGIVGYIVQARLQSVFKKYSKVQFPGGLTGAEVAEKMLRDNNIHNVKVTHVGGHLTDHFNPQTMTVNLSDSVYSSSSVAAAAVAAHECGHAVQHAQGYAPLVLRSQLVPVVQFASSAATWVIILGLVILASTQNELLCWIGVGMIAMSAVFSLVTLPVEYNASARALEWLQVSRTMQGAQLAQAKEALSWAARTYLVAALSAIASVLYYVFLILGRRD